MTPHTSTRRQRLWHEQSRCEACGQMTTAELTRRDIEDAVANVCECCPACAALSDAELYYHQDRGEPFYLQYGESPR